LTAQVVYIYVLNDTKQALINTRKDAIIKHASLGHWLWKSMRTQRCGTAWRMMMICWCEAVCQVSFHTYELRFHIKRRVSLTSERASLRVAWLVLRYVNCRCSLCFVQVRRETLAQRWRGSAFDIEALNTSWKSLPGKATATTCSSFHAALVSGATKDYR